MVKVQKRLLALILSILMLMSLVTINVTASADHYLTLTPASSTGGPWDIIKVTLGTNTAFSVAGFEARVIYDPTAFQLDTEDNDFDGYPDGVTLPTAAAFKDLFTVNIDNTNGIVFVGGLKVGGGAWTQTVARILCDFHFTVLPTAVGGGHDFTYGYVEFASAAGEPIPLGTHVPASISTYGPPPHIPEVTWPTVSAITYGQTFADAMGSDGVSDVPGAFTIQDAATVPNAGSYSKRIYFTPDDLHANIELNRSFDITVNKADPTGVTWPTLGAVDYVDGLTLAAVTLPVGFVWVTPSTALSAPGGSYPATFTPADTNNYNTLTQNITVVVNPAAQGGLYLKTSSGSGQPGDEVTVTVSISDANGTHAFQANVNYNPAALKLDTEDNDFDGYPDGVILPTAAAFKNLFTTNVNNTTGTVFLGGLKLGGGNWTTSGERVLAQLRFTILPGALNGSHQLTFNTVEVVNASADILPLETHQVGAITVTGGVDKLTPTVTWPTVSAITYGQTFANAMSGGSANVPGTFAIEDAATVPNAGSYSKKITFTPNDIATYSVVEQSFNITVNKVDPVVTWPTLGSVVYTDGLTLAAVTLPAGFVWVTPSTALSAPGGSYPATYTPADTTNYNTLTQNIAVTVNPPGPPYLQVTSGAGQPGDEVVVTVSISNAQGTHAFQANVNYNPAALKLDTEDNDFDGYPDGVMLPTDAAFKNLFTTNVNNTTGTVFLGGLKMGGGNWTTSGTRVLAVLKFKVIDNAFNGSHQLTFNTVEVVNADASIITLGTHEAGTIAVTGGVDIIDPVISKWPTISSINYGKTFADAMASDGVVDVSGVFTIADATVKPNAGTYTKTIIFTPNNTALYRVMTQDVTVTVNKIDPTVTWPTLSAVTYSPTLKLSDITLPANFTWVAPSTALSVPGGSYSMTYTPVDTNNYNTLTNNVSVTVNKANPSGITWPTQATVTYTPTLKLSDIALPAGFAWAAPTTALNVPGGSYSMVYTPEDTNNYNTLTNNVSVVVNKATPVVTWPTLSAVTYTPTLKLSDITLAAGFTWADPTTALSVPGASYNMIYTHPDTNNYNTVTSNVAVTVNKASQAAPTSIEVAKTKDSITITPIFGAEYGIKLKGSSDAVVYGASNVFGGLIPLTEYTVFVRIASTANYNESVAYSTDVTTDPNTVPITGLELNTPTNLNQVYGDVKAVNFTVTTTPTEPVDLSTIEWYVNGMQQENSGATFTYTPTNAAGEYKVSVKIAGNDTELDSKTIVVGKGTPDVTVPGPFEYTYESGKTLEDVVLPGGWAWDAKETVLNVPGGSFSATFTPVDEANLNTLQANITVKINKANLIEVANWPTDTKVVTYRSGLTLGNSGIQLPAGYAWDNPSTYLYYPGGSYLATFTDPSGNYNPFTDYIKVAVNNPPPGGSRPSGGGISFPSVVQPVVPTPVPEDEGKEEVIPNKPVPGDVAQASWAQDYIQDVVNRGIMSGYSEVDGTTSFRPNATATRAEFATALFNYLGFEQGGSAAFGDTQDHWASSYIAKMVNEGIMTGYSASEFGPDDTITREQMAVILYRAFKLKASTSGFEYSDDSSISSWATESVYAVREAGWMTGDTIGTFRATDTASRAEIATIFSRLAKLGIK